MKKFHVIALFLFLAGICIPQTASTYVSPEVRRTGDKLACKCGGCANTVGNCQMLGCHYSSPAREKIAKMQQEGLSDDVIVASFVKETGIAALAAPPASGFNLIGWLMPFAAILLGLAAILAYMRSRTRQPEPTPAAAGEPKPPVDPKYQRQIEADLAEME